MSDEVTARRLVVRGRVQGVGFRYWTVATAREMGVSGWARNRPDGTVEIHAEGRAEAVEALTQACHRGPPAARVDAVEGVETSPEQPDGFSQKPTG